MYHLSIQTRQHGLQRTSRPQHGQKPVAALRAESFASRRYTPFLADDAFEKQRRAPGQSVHRTSQHLQSARGQTATPSLRVWDTYSGSQPDPSSANRMLARLSRGELATKDIRRASLTTHADQSIWEKTPYISFTSSPRAALDLINARVCYTSRGDQNLVVIDPEYRLERGLPILDMGKEMELYGVKNPYRRDYFSNHFVCLWEVTAAEVVGTWRWDQLRRDNGWYENVIMPAFKERRAA